MEKADIVIVGGGIAGLAVAVTLCSGSTLDVVLVEKRGIGANKTTPVVFPETIKEFGLSDSIYQYYSRYVFHSPLGAMARFDYQRNALASLNYRKACIILYEQAASNGLELCQAKAVNWSPAIPEPAHPLLINLDNGDNLQTQVLIDASGQAQWAAKQLRIRLSPCYSVCYGEFLTGCSFEDSSTFRLLAPNRRYGTGGGWFYPIGVDSASVGYAILVREPCQADKNLAAGYRAAKQEFQPYADWVKEGVRQQVEGGIIPVGRIGRFVDHRILIVGDAAGQANPWLMMGTNPGLNNGRLCAQVVLRAFAKKRFDRSMLSLYERQWAKSNRGPFWRAASTIEPVLMEQTDEGWDQFVAASQSLSPEQQLRQMRDNHASVFQKVYAVVGYARRQFVRWVRGPRL
jgi:digeranylgeranylglycerophospholipid reductase